MVTYMDERQIRERTNMIADAFLEFNDIYENVSLNDFMIIRTMAVEELKTDSKGFARKTFGNISRKRDTDNYDTADIQAHITSSENKQKNLSSASKKAELNNVLHMPESHLAKGNVPQKHIPDEQNVHEQDFETKELADDKPLSKMELLRSMPDEWN